MNMNLSVFAVFEKVAAGADIVYSRFSSKWWWGRMDVTKQVEDLLAQDAIKSVWFIPKGSHLGCLIVVEQPDYSSDAASGDADRITPDPAGDDVADAVTVAPALTKLEIYAGDADTAYYYKRTMLRLYGPYDVRTRRAVAVHDSLGAAFDNLKKSMIRS